jgi:hypothetical protein
MASKEKQKQKEEETTATAAYKCRLPIDKLK